MQSIGVLIAGGKSSRMGQDKALLEVDGITQLERSQRLLHDAGCTEVMISRNAEGYVADCLPDTGPLGGLLSVLHQLNTPARLLVLPIDMPLLTAEALSLLIEQPHAAFFAASPLPCVVENTPELLSYLTHQLCDDAGDHSVRGMLSAFGAQALDWPYTYQLQNTNTPQQWQRAIELLGVTA